jgi:hypothetical protein
VSINSEEVQFQFIDGCLIVLLFFVTAGSMTGRASAITVEVAKSVKR